jgi:regulator of sigma E protease
MLTLMAFFLAVCVLIAVHESGHYLMARWCGVGVVKFSIGFGPTLLKWRNAIGTEFALGAVPLGGYVRMLDEHESPVESSQKHRAFNRQPVRLRWAIVAAGPLANFMLAVLFYACVTWIGQTLPAPILSTPPVNSLAKEAGLQAGEVISHMGFEGDDDFKVQSFDDVRWWITRALVKGVNLQLNVQDASGRNQHLVVLPIMNLVEGTKEAEWFQKIGITQPFRSAVLQDVQIGGPAYRAGLQSQDEIVEIDGLTIQDAAQLQQVIRALTTIPSTWKVQRNGLIQQLQVQAEVFYESGITFGRVGVWVGGLPHRVWVQQGWFEGLWSGLNKAWEASTLSLQTLGRIVTGEISLKNISGPLTMAEYAGTSARLGINAYLSYLALISVSICVLNLLPIPLLDGGHLLLLSFEAVRGKAVSEACQNFLQKGGLVILVGIMSVALFNDVVRLF